MSETRGQLAQGFTAPEPSKSLDLKQCLQAFPRNTCLGCKHSADYWLLIQRRNIFRLLTNACFNTLKFIMLKNCKTGKPKAKKTFVLGHLGHLLHSQLKEGIFDPRPCDGWGLWRPDPKQGSKANTRYPRLPFTVRIITIIAAIIFHSQTISTHITYASVKLEVLSSAERAEPD